MNPPHKFYVGDEKFFRGRATGSKVMGASSAFESNSEYCKIRVASQNVGAKLHAQKGNSPDRSLRSLNIC